MKYGTRLLFSLIIIVCGLLNCGPSTQELPKETDRDGMGKLKHSLRDVRFVAYSPTVFNPLPDQRVPATAETIRTDLEVLGHYFDGLIIYSCITELGMDKVVPIAQKLGYRAIILGIWNITSQAEIQTAVDLVRSHPDLIVGLIVGNEGLTMGHYDWEDIEVAVPHLRSLLPGLPLSTSEPIGAYGDIDLLDIVDFHTPNIHWWFSGDDRRDYQGAVKWLQDRIAAIQSFSEKPILVKEASLPSGPAPHASEEIQMNFWKTLLETIENTETLAIAFFEAYDAGDWKTITNPSDVSAVEKNWGAFTNDRQPKPVVDVLPKIR
jgi:exo-beta-1,3-glucanase (GH17 family)